VIYTLSYLTPVNVVYDDELDEIRLIEVDADQVAPPAKWVLRMDDQDATPDEAKAIEDAAWDAMTRVWRHGGSGTDWTLPSNWTIRAGLPEALRPQVVRS
jgi:hypothetical protein